MRRRSVQWNSWSNKEKKPPEQKGQRQQQQEEENQEQHQQDQELPATTMKKTLLGKSSRGILRNNTRKSNPANNNNNYSSTTKPIQKSVTASSNTSSRILPSSPNRRRYASSNNEKNLPDGIPAASSFGSNSVPEYFLGFDDDNDYDDYGVANNATSIVQRDSIDTETAPPPFSQLELDELKDAFTLFDTNDSGRISCQELFQVLSSLQGDSMAPHLQKLLRTLSTMRNKDRLLDWMEFVDLMANSTIINSHSHNHFEQVFELFDVHKKGFITIHDLQRVATDLGEHDITMEELQDMIDKCSTSENNSGQVTRQEFCALMKQPLFDKENN